MEKVFEINGTPKPQKRHRSSTIKTKNGKSFQMNYDPSAKDKKIFAKHLIEFDYDPYENAICVDMDFYFPRPMSHFGTGKNAAKLKPQAPKYHTQTPDKDNLEKFVMDSLNGVLWEDDKIICDGRVRKLWTVENDGWTEIRITELK